ncbi:MAG: cell division protein FtsL [Hyphomicrobiaceae bacterium]
MHRLRQLTTTASITAAILSAVALYAVKQETRVALAEVTALEQSIAAQDSEIALLKAELANRARPDRIAKLARTHLGMKPLSPGQLGEINKLPWREGAVAEGAPASVAP